MTRPGTLIRWYAIHSLLKKTVDRNNIVLDIGAFDGYILGKLIKEINIVPFLLDLDSSGLDVAKKKGIHSLLGSGTSIALKKNSVDVVLCLDVIEHIHEDRALLNEIARILKIDGIMILSTPIADKKLVILLSEKQMNELHIQWGHVKPGYTLEELQCLFKELNFDIIYSSQYFNFITRYLYYLLYYYQFPIPHKMKQIIFKTGLFFERFIKYGCLEHVIIIKNGR